MLERTVKEISTVKMSPPAIKDEGTVRMGYATPAFPLVRTEPANVVDNGKVRIGYATPAFPTVRAR
jgi:hypothetical protein